MWWDMSRPFGLEGVERVLVRVWIMVPELDGKVREALAMFADECSAHRYLERLLWPDGVCCPRCRSSARVGKLDGASTRLGTYKCYSCRKAFSLVHGTVMSSSHVPAHKWLQAIYLTEGGTRSMRPHRLQQILNVSLKTASSMMRRLSEAADGRRPASTTRALSPAPRSPSPTTGIARVVDTVRSTRFALSASRRPISMAATATAVQQGDPRTLRGTTISRAL